MPTIRLPTVVQPYGGPTRDAGLQDLFVYLRPETNGVKVESVLLSVIRGDPRYRERIALVYLANLPGDFIVQRRVVEHHYATRLHFTRKGKAAFTPSMRRRFEEYFHTGFEEATVLGAFEVVASGRYRWDELFDLWVSPNDLCELNGQTIKRIGDLFVINYDIPALLRKNNGSTDIAVMLFRSSLTYADFRELVRLMGRALVEHGILGERVPLARAFHFSKGPFEQILDALGFLYGERGEHLPILLTSFCDFLMRKGMAVSTILDAVRNPIMHFRNGEGDLVEEDLLVYTFGESYEGAYAKLLTVVAQPLV